MYYSSLFLRYFNTVQNASLQIMITQLQKPGGARHLPAVVGIVPSTKHMAVKQNKFHIIYVHDYWEYIEIEIDCLR